VVVGAKGSVVSPPSFLLFYSRIGGALKIVEFASSRKSCRLKSSSSLSFFPLETQGSRFCAAQQRRSFFFFSFSEGARADGFSERTTPLIVPPGSRGLRTPSFSLSSFFPPLFEGFCGNVRDGSDPPASRAGGEGLWNALGRAPPFPFLFPSPLQPRERIDCASMRELVLKIVGAAHVSPPLLPLSPPSSSGRNASSRGILIHLLSTALKFSAAGDLPPFLTPFTTVRDNGVFECAIRQKNC